MKREDVSLFNIIESFLNSYYFYLKDVFVLCFILDNSFIYFFKKIFHSSYQNNYFFLHYKYGLRKVFLIKLFAGVTVFLLFYSPPLDTYGFILIVSSYCLYVLKLTFELLIYMVRKFKKSPFDAPGIQAKATTNDILAVVKESRGKSVE